MSKWFRVTTDPDKPCMKEFVIFAGSEPEAVRKAVLKAHTKESGCELLPENIGDVEHVTDYGDVNYVVTVVPTDANNPLPTPNRFKWLTIDGVWFWVHCISRPCRDGECLVSPQ